MLESGPMDRATGVGFTRARMGVGMLGSLSGGLSMAMGITISG